MKLTDTETLYYYWIIYSYFRVHIYLFNYK